MEFLFLLCSAVTQRPPFRLAPDRLRKAFKLTWLSYPSSRRQMSPRPPNFSSAWRLFSCFHVAKLRPNAHGARPSFYSSINQLHNENSSACTCAGKHVVCSRMTMFNVNNFAKNIRHTTWRPFERLWAFSLVSDWSRRLWVGKEASFGRSSGNFSAISFVDPIQSWSFEITPTLYTVIRGTEHFMTRSTKNPSQNSAAALWGLNI